MILQFTLYCINFQNVYESNYHFIFNGWQQLLIYLRGSTAMPSL